MAWADEFRTLKVRTNADTPADAKKARELGAEGIGLCRTEHMFFEGNRIDAFREMICAETVEEREAALAKILPEQQGDFEKLYEALEGNPVTIRFLDPPLHEFVPTEEEDIKKLADAQGKTVDQIKAIIDSLHEFNPMMGHRGCRLAVTYPEIAKMQTSAVIRAAINVKKAHPDWNVKPEIMIPLVGDIKELKYVKKFVVETADAEIAAAGSDLEYEVGTMIEIPRAALTADQIASEADFFCFGTNDLTQLTEDLVEASKISSGNITLTMQEINLKQLIKQTNGEFEEKFEAKNLDLICNLPEEQMLIMADGRRMFRVIENLYNNAAKYAMPGTRVYVNGSLEGDNVIFSMKNVSENPLNFKADELMERFVRGDVSRSSEGSGLGLEIARNLTVMQNGTFDLYLDGDLFKVVIIFDKID